MSLPLVKPSDAEWSKLSGTPICNGCVHFNLHQKPTDFCNAATVLWGKNPTVSPPHSAANSSPGWCPLRRFNLDYYVSDKCISCSSANFYRSLATCSKMPKHYNRISVNPGASKQTLTKIIGVGGIPLDTKVHLAEILENCPRKSPQQRPKRPNMIRKPLW